MIIVRWNHGTLTLGVAIVSLAGAVITFVCWLAIEAMGRDE